MTVRQINLLLWTATGVLGASAAAVLAGGWLMPLESPPATTAALSPNTPSRRTASAQSFSAIVSRPYRSSLDGSFTPSAVPKDPNGATPDAIQLTGVIGTLAILRGPDGSDALAEVGDDVNGDPVVAIRPAELDLRTANGIVTLHLLAPPDGTMTAPATEPSNP